MSLTEIGSWIWTTLVWVFWITVAVGVVDGVTLIVLAVRGPKSAFKAHKARSRTAWLSLIGVACGIHVIWPYLTQEEKDEWHRAKNDPLRKP